MLVLQKGGALNNQGVSRGPGKAIQGQEPWPGLLVGQNVGQVEDTEYKGNLVENPGTSGVSLYLWNVFGSNGCLIKEMD